MFIRNNTRGRVKWLSTALMFLCIVIICQDVNAEPKKYRLGDIPLSPEAYEKHLKKIPRDMFTMEAALPPSYDARESNIVTDPKNQGNCGSCWAFASVGALESHLLKAGKEVQPPDLSEQQQVSCNDLMLGCGGGSSYALLYWGTMEQGGTDKGPLNESYFQYTASDGTPCMEMEDEQLGYRVVDYHTVPVSTDGFKQSLYDYGPSYWRFDVYSDFYTFWGTYSPGAVYVNGSNSYEGGHAVLLIGWDDYKQAFLCKNSWGGGGPNGDGTFWIAYEGHYKDLRFGMANFDIVSLTCSSDEECDDGNVCNGVETCDNNGVCQQGESMVCIDDGYFCNGTEFCDETIGCTSIGTPCNAEETCDEVNDLCVPETCGNGSCDVGEDCINCGGEGGDCISGPGGGTCEACFKGLCNGDCHPIKEGPECTDCSPPYCCGDGVCNDEENSENCAIDCGGEPPVTEIVCDDGSDNDEDGLTDCDDPDCGSDPACGCSAKKESCEVNSDCCSNRCSKQGVCL